MNEYIRLKYDLAPATDEVEVTIPLNNLDWR